MILSTEVESRFPSPLKESEFDDCRSLITGLANKDPAKRIGSTFGAIDIKEHAFFSGVNWDAVLNKQYLPEFVPKVESSATGRGSVMVKNFDTMFTQQKARDSVVSQVRLYDVRVHRLNSVLLAVTGG
jgi:hypothetical protein